MRVAPYRPCMPRKPAAPKPARPASARARARPGSAAPDAPPPERSPRPRPLPTFRDIAGQPLALGLLARAIESRRVHHAWIFHGPVGTGKCTTALAFARALLTPPDHAGPDHPAARALDRADHPDLHIVTRQLAALSRDDKVRERKQLTIAKEVVEEFLIEPAVRTPVLPSGSTAAKVFIVDEAELLDRSATHAPTQNALLKTLEEPPEGTVIILVTSDESRLLPTIRSRAARVPFFPLAEADLAPLLDRFAAEAGRPVTDAERAWLVEAADGSPGAAQLALRFDLFAWHNTVEPMLDQLLSGRYPLALAPTLARLVDERAAASIEGQPGASKDAANRAWARRMFAFLAGGVRRRLRAHAADPEPAAQYAEMLESIHEAEGLVESNVQLALVMESLVARIAGTGAPA